MYELRFSDAALVESTLGIPLFPSGFDINEALSQQPEGRCDVRIKAIDITLSALTHLLGRRPNDQEPLMPHEQFLLRNHHDIHFVQNLVAIANNIYMSEAEGSSSPQVQGADDPSTPRAKVQIKLTKGMFKHTQTVPDELEYSPDTPLHNQFDDTYVVIAPTAVGKTVLEARLLRAAGIGRQVGTLVKRIMRGMVTTSNLKLVKQFVGQRGDNTFRRFLGDIVVEPAYARHKGSKAPVGVTTDRSMVKLNPREFAMGVVDEAHLALGPQALQYIRNIGMRCFMFTATPAYSKKADLRHLFRYVEEGTLRGFVEQGVLNPARLMTFYYDDHPEVAAALLADKYIKAGRKVVVYCQSGSKDDPGGPSKKVAALVNKLQGKQVAQAVGDHNKNSDDDVERFDNGELKLLSTSRMLREGWNADVDVAICNGPHYSILDLQQKVGRPLRPGRFISELIELVPRIRKANRPMVSLWQLFGLEEVISGTIIGAAEDDKEGGCLIPPDDSWMFGADRSSGGDDSWTFGAARSSSGYGKTPSATRPQTEEGGVNLSTLPEDLLENMVVDKPVRSVIMGVNFLPTEGFASASKLAKQFGVPSQFVHLKLDQQGFSYEGLWLPDKDGEFKYDRWYESAALDYLEANPIPKEAGEMELIADEGAALCGVSKNFFLKVADSLSITPHDRMGKGRRTKAKCYDLTQLVTILAAIEAIPLAAEDDIPIVELQEELSCTFAPNSKGIYKRRNPVHGITGWCQHVSFTEAQDMRAAYYAFPVADERFISITAAAEAADLSLYAFRANFTEDERAALRPMRKRPKGFPVEHLPRAVADPLIERVKPDKLEPYLVPFPIIQRRVNRSEPVLRDRLKAIGYEAVPRRFTKRPSSCYPWAALQKLEEQCGRKPGIPAINFENLVQGPDDFDEDRWTYTQEVQKKYLSADGIRRMQTLEEAREKDRQANQAQQEAPVEPVSTPADEKRPTPAEDIPARPSAEQPMAPVRPKPAPIPPPTIPDGYIDLDAYLEERGMACEPSIARVLARTHSVPAPIADVNERLWADDETAITLEEAIRKYETAAQGSLSPHQIARLFPDADLKGENIMHFVSKKNIKLQGHTKICRELQSDGSPGALRLHYDLELTSRVRGLLSKLVRDASRLEALRNFADNF